MKASFLIENIQLAEPALKPNCVFSSLGGYIGSAIDATWRIQDLSGQIPNVAARISFIDQRFTLEVFGTAAVRLNGAASSIPAGRPVVLNDNDHLVIGDLNIAVRISEELSVPQTHGLSGLVQPSNMADNTLLIDGDFAESISGRDPDKPIIDDPLAALDKAVAGSGHIELVDRGREFDELQAAGGQLNTKFSRAEGTHQSDARIEVNSAMSFQKAPSFLFDSDSRVEDVDAVSDASNSDGFKSKLSSSGLRGEATSLAPLATALGVSQSYLDRNDRILADIGTALRVAIEGLNELYRARSSKTSRIPFTAHNAHLAEDNPLRFAESAQEALNAFLIERQALHLSAPAAMAEGFNSLLQHQDATETAIDHALAAVFAALKPEALEQRFANYAQSVAPPNGQEREAWCWRIYKVFLTELASPRQDGLQKLFWETFAYEYLAAMRASERSSTVPETHK